MIDWIRTMAGETRGKVLGLLRESAKTINELASALGITDNAVRTHIAALERDGMVSQAGVERSTGGKPARIYGITPEAEELFPKAYALVLSEVIATLEEREGRDGVERLLRDVGVRLAGGEAQGSLEHRVAAAVAALGAIGGEVDAERVAEGWLLRAHGCPLSAVIGDHPEVCALAETLVAELTGAAVEESCERGERPRCAFRVLAESGG